MDDDLIDFAIVFGLLLVLVALAIALLIMNAERLHQAWRRCTTRRDGVGSESTSPRRTTIRVAKSLPNQLGDGPRKPVARRVTSNPPKVSVANEVDSPMSQTTTTSEQFVFIYPKRPAYKVEAVSQSQVHPPLTGKHSGSTKSSYLPNSIGTIGTRRTSN